MLKNAIVFKNKIIMYHVHNYYVFGMNVSVAQWCTLLPGAKSGCAGYTLNQLVSVEIERQLHEDYCSRLLKHREAWYTTNIHSIQFYEHSRQGEIIAAHTSILSTYDKAYTFHHLFRAVCIGLKFPNNALGGGCTG